MGGRFFRTADYRIIGQDQSQARKASDRLDGWQRGPVAERHHRLWHQGVVRPGTQNLTDALGYFPTARTVLEVGCGTGYNLSVMAADGLSVVGVDNSMAMLALTRSTRVTCAAAGALPLATRGADLVVDGGTLIHVVDWQDALAEQARVARMGVILHSVTVTEAPTTYLFKRAYGYPVPEVVFNEVQLRDELATHGLALTAVLQDFRYDLQPWVGLRTRAQTWVLACDHTR